MGSTLDPSLEGSDSLAQDQAGFLASGDTALALGRWA